MKIAIVVDSSCGMSKKEVEAKGWYFLPLYINIDGKEYADGIDIEAKEFYSMIKPEMKVRTSATPTGIIMDTLEKASKENDGVIVYSLSKGLSSQNQNISMVAKEFKNVKVLESQAMSIAIAKSCDQILDFAKTAKTIEEVEKFGNVLAKQIGGILVPERMDWLVSGGRVSPAAAKMAGMLKIIPVIGFIDGKLIKYGKGRTFEKTIIKSAVSLQESYKGSPRDWICLHSGNPYAEKMRDMLLKEMKLDEMEINYIPPVIGIHTGSQAFCIMAIPPKKV